MNKSLKGIKSKEVISQKGAIFENRDDDSGLGKKFTLSSFTGYS